MIVNGVERCLRHFFQGSYIGNKLTGFGLYPQLSFSIVCSLVKGAVEGVFWLLGNMRGSSEAGIGLYVVKSCVKLSLCLAIGGATRVVYCIVSQIALHLFHFAVGSYFAGASSSWYLRHRDFLVWVVPEEVVAFVRGRGNFA